MLIAVMRRLRSSASLYATFSTITCCTLLEYTLNLLQMQVQGFHQDCLSGGGGFKMGGGAFKIGGFSAKCGIHFSFYLPTCGMC